MTDTQISAQQLLDKILSAGRDIVAESQTRSGELTAKGKEIAAKGEDVLIDKLGIEDTETSREALRKGVGVGAAAGALALLLSSRSGRKVATLGGLAGLGMLAYQAYQKNGGEMPNWREEVSGFLGGTKADNRAEMLIRAMVAAAKADGTINENELTLIKAHEAATLSLLKSALSQKPDAREIASLADSQQAAREIYAVSARIADGLTARERDYLDQLAMALKLDPEFAAHIETDVRTG